MTVSALPRGGAALPVRVATALRSLVVGALFCLTPLTALIALGWISRRTRGTILARWGGPSEAPGWVLGPAGHGWLIRALGGLAANIRAGVSAATGLAVLTLPFSFLWLGAWWAGWENSFNKGYEQAAVGPLVWLAGTLLSLPILNHLPIAMAHAASEARLSAFFEWRRIRSVAVASGWRLVWLSMLGVLLAIPVLILRAIPIFIEDLVPGFSDMATDRQREIGDMLRLIGAAVAFLYVLILREQAALAYARAAPVAARGGDGAAWRAHPAADVAPEARPPRRVMSAIWTGLAALTWAALAVLIVVGQFLNYAQVNWLTHPAFLLPWVN